MFFLCIKRAEGELFMHKSRLLLAQNANKRG